MSIATDAGSTQVYELYIRATPELLWAAITEPGQIAQYCRGAIVDRRLEPGGQWQACSPDREQLWNDGRVLESRPPRRLCYTWTSLWDPDAAEEPHSRVTWEIEPVEDMICKLTVVHDQLEASPKTAASVGRHGWLMIMCGLKTLVETGRPMARALFPGSTG